MRMKLGWIGIGRMGYEMAARLAKGGADVLAWNRTRAKGEPLAQYGAKVATHVGELSPRGTAGAVVSEGTRTREKAEPLAQYGAKVATNVAELAPRDIVFCMVSTWN